MGTCSVENRLLVGLAAETGEMGVRGIALGDLSANDGREAFCAWEVFRDSRGLAAERAALYMLIGMDARRFGLTNAKDNVGF